ncbi:MAG: acyl carrier protein [Actinomycetota bacterium]|nr:acyl carrier protein [Actinomycetota bacterium]
MDRDEVFSTFQGCVAEVLDIEAGEVKPEARWREDLDADSLAVVEITLALNDAFSIKVPDVDPDQLVTVGQAFDLVLGLIDV